MCTTVLLESAVKPGVRIEQKDVVTILDCQLSSVATYISWKPALSIKNIQQ